MKDRYAARFMSLPPGLRVLAGYLLPLLVLYRDLLFAGRTWLDFDFLVENRVRFEILQEGIANNQLPIWTDTYLGGFPVAFSEFGWFYPVSWLFLRVLPMPLAYHAETAAGLLLAALGAYWLGRAWGLSRLAAFVGGYLYGFAPFIFATSVFVNFADVMWVLPVALLAIERLAQGRFRYLPVLAVAAAVAILAGHPHIALIIAFAATLFAAFRLVWTYRDAGRPAAARLLALLLGAGLLGLTLGAVRLLPTLALTAASTRAGGLDAATASGGELNPLSLLLGYVYPAFDLPRIADGGLRAEPLAYAGLLAVVLALVAASGRRRERRVGFLLALLALSWLLAFGDSAPPYRVLRQMPVFDLFREPGRYLLPGVLALALLAGFGLDALACTGDTHRRFARRAARLLTIYALGLLAVLVIGTVLLKGGGDFGNRAIDLVFVGGEDAFVNESGWLGAFALARGRLETAFTLANWTPALAILTAAAAAVVLGRLARGRLAASTAAAALAAVLLIDVSLSPGHGIPTLGPEISDSTPVTVSAVGELREGRVFSYRSLADKSELGLGSGRELSPVARRRLEYRFARELLTPNLAGRYGLRSLDGYENLMSRTQAEALAYLGSERTTVAGFAADDSLSEGAKAELLRQRLPVLGVFGVATLIAGTDLIDSLGVATLAHRAAIPFAWEGPLVFVYSLPFVRGDYYVTANWQADDPAESTEAALDRLAADPALVLLDGDPFIAPARALAAVVRVLRAEPGDWSFAVDAGGPGVLVLNQSALPGWAASVDGRPVDLLVANRLMLGVPVPAGASRVEFIYTPPGYAAGIVFSLIGLGLLLATGVAVLATARKGPA
jgi:hypothetical protein